MKDIKLAIGRTLSNAHAQIDFADQHLEKLRYKRISSRVCINALSAELTQIRIDMRSSIGKAHSKLAIRANALRKELRNFETFLSNYKELRGEHIVKQDKYRKTMLETYESCAALGVDADECVAAEVEDMKNRRSQLHDMIGNLRNIASVK